MYDEIYLPKHHKAKPNGMVRIHVLKAEEKIQRPLKPNEVVHHLDENSLNNDLSNLIVFISNSAHVTFHKTNILTPTKEEFVFDSINPDKICPYCGEVKQIKAYKCKKCYYEQDTKVNLRPSKDELKNLLTQHNFSYVGRMFNVSDNAVRKWCKKYGMSTKAKDYKQV